MKILYILPAKSRGTGSGTYAGMVIKYMSLHHEVEKIGPEALNTINTEKFDIIHALDMKSLGNDSIIRKLNPLAIDVHDHYWVEFKRYPAPDFPLRYIFQKQRKAKYPALLSKAKAVVCHSEAVLNAVEHKNCAIVPLAVEADMFSSARNAERNENTVAFIGRDFFRKGLPLLIKAIKQVQESIKDVKLVVAGREYLHSKLYCKALAMGAPVEFAGSLDNEEVLDLLARAKVLVLPSWEEAFGITLLEAQAAGVPTIGTNVGGIPEALDNGKAGILVERGNVPELAKAIVKCLEGGDEIEGIKKHAMDRIISEYTPERMVKALEIIYEKVIV